MTANIKMPGTLVFPIRWAIDNYHYTGRAEMRVIQPQTEYRAYIVKSGSVYAEISIDVSFDGSNWIQIDKHPKKFTHFFLNALGNAIQEAQK